jgi:hypothetical protein
LKINEGFRRGFKQNFFAGIGDFFKKDKILFKYHEEIIFFRETH